MIPCTSSLQTKKSWLRSRSNHGTGPQSRPRRLSAIEEKDGSPAAKKCRAANHSISANSQQNVVNNCLGPHITHAIDLRVSGGIETWPETVRRVSLSSLSAGYHETEQLIDEYLEVRRQNEIMSRESESDRYFWGGSNLFVESLNPDFWQMRTTPSHLSNGSSTANMQQPSSLALAPAKRVREHAYESTSALATAFYEKHANTFLERLPPLQLPVFNNWQTPFVPSFPVFPGTENSTSFQHYSVNATSRVQKPPNRLPAILALPEDHFKLSAHQILLRHQIEAFEASEDDVKNHLRGRNKKLKRGQVGIRCRHCAHVPGVMRQKGSVYFPSTLLGLYQAAQNMSTLHLQCGACSQTPLAVKQQFAALMSTRAFSSGAGRPYWAEAAKKLGLVETDEVLRFIRDESNIAL